MASMGYRVGRAVRNVRSINVRGINPRRLIGGGSKRPKRAPVDADSMTLQEHLLEFRDRLIKITLSVIGGMIVGFFFAGRLYNHMLAVARHVNPNIVILQLDATEAFVTYFKVALYIGVVIASPIVLYQIVRFLAPGLLPHELKYILWGIPVVAALFILGVVFANYFVIPQFLKFLIDFSFKFLGSWSSTSQSFLAFYMRISIGIGLIFQLPAILFVLAKVRVVNIDKLRRWRRYAFLLCAIAAAAITPTPDPFNMLIVMAPMYLLYEVGTVCSYFALPRNDRGKFFRRPKLAA